jgi:hypothetical protein
MEPPGAGSDNQPLLLADASLLRERHDRPPDEIHHVALLDEREARLPARVDIARLDRRFLALDHVQPIAVVPVYLPRRALEERGPVAFSVTSLDADQQRSVVGGRMQLTTAEDEHSRLMCETRLLWLYEYLQVEDGGAGGGNFFSPGDRAVFAVQGLQYGSNWALLGSGLRWELAGGWSAYTHYDAQVNSQQVYYLGSGGINISW